MILSRAGAGATEYGAYVSAMHGWLAPIEPALWSAPWPDDVEPALRDGKCEWLRDDMTALGIATSPMAAPVVAMDSHAARFGLAYVIEGSQLGGQVLARRFRPVLPFEPRYLVGYGSETGTLWKRFAGALARHVTTDEDIARAARAAHDAFAGLADWFHARGVA